MLVKGMLWSGQRDDGYLDICVSSLGLEDETDNSSNGNTSSICYQSSHWLKPASGGSECLICTVHLSFIPIGDGMLSPYKVCLNKVPILQSPGRQRSKKISIFMSLLCLLFTALGRGHNVVLLCAHSGAFICSRSFDTWGDTSAGASLLEFLEPFVSPEPPRLYLLIITVLDSGENGGDALNKFFKGFNFQRHLGVFSLPGHRESWLFVAYIGAREDSDSTASCESCSGTLYDIDSKGTSALGNPLSTGPASLKDPNIKSSVPVREVLYFASNGRGKGGSFAKLSIPISPSSFAEDVTLEDVGRYEPHEILKYIFPERDEKVSCFVSRIRGDCLLDSSVRGFCLVSSEDIASSLDTNECGAEGEDVVPDVMCLLFGSAGFPLVKCCDRVVFARSYVKCCKWSSRLSEVSEMIGADSISNCRPSHCSFSYVDIGGKHHDDTISFDTTFFLSSLPGVDPSFSNLKLIDVQFSGGETVVFCCD